MNEEVRLGVLISGSGTNLQAIIDAVEQGKLPVSIGVVISNVDEVEGIERAKRHGLPSRIIRHTEFPTRESFEKTLVAELDQHGVNLVILAGFLRLLSPSFVRRYPNRIMNIHPSLLPAFPGLNVQKKAIDHGVRFSGCTVHFVDEECDHGPIIIQAAVPVYPNDAVEELAERILREEHRIYPLAIRFYAEGRLRIEGRRVFVEGLQKEEKSALIHPTI
jgi:phosphoribosylglycinamide formyltransferase-1